jgi:hypothetical protein
MNAGAHAGNALEWEANDFASELLMPRHLFSADMKGRDPIFREVVELAAPEMYDVSVTAAALRLIDVTRQDCALVCARRGIVEWVAKSESFRYRIPWRNDRVPPNSAASAVFNGEAPASEAEQLDPYTWLEMEQRIPVELFESTFQIPSQSQVLSLVWVVSEASWV